MWDRNQTRGGRHTPDGVCTGRESLKKEITTGLNTVTGLEDRDLQHAACLAFLARLTRFAVLGRAFHIVAAVHPHVVHHRHAHRLHWARFCRCLNARHPAEGKRQANHEDDTKPQIAFHGLECSLRKQRLSFEKCLSCLLKDAEEA
jgi:hypothetical protein